MHSIEIKLQFMFRNNDRNCSLALNCYKYLNAGSPKLINSNQYKLLWQPAQQPKRTTSKLLHLNKYFVLRMYVLGTSLSKQALSLVAIVIVIVVVLNIVITIKTKISSIMTSINQCPYAV